MSLATHTLIKVKDVKNDCYLLTNGGLRAVLEVSGINFHLLSEQEQNLMIGGFKNFLDGLDFFVEILIISRLENIDNYLKILHLRLEEETEPLIKFQIQEYVSFLEDYLENHKIMKKLFYLIIPYDSSLSSLSLTSLVQKPKKEEKDKKEESFDVKLQQLESRIIYVSRSLTTLGLHVKRLADKELIELLFEVYNPNLRWGQIPRPIIEKLEELKK